MSYLLPKIIASITIGTTGAVIYKQRIPLATIYLTKQIENTNNITMPSWYQYESDSIYSQEKYIQLLMNAVTEKKLILTEQIADLICNFADDCPASFDLQPDLHHELILFYASHPLLLKYTQVHKLCRSYNIDIRYFNLLKKYPNDICYLRYLSKTLILHLLKDIASDKPEITITSLFAEIFVTDLVIQGSYLAALPNPIKMNSDVFQKLIEKNPKVIRCLGKSNAHYLCSDLCTQLDIDNFLFKNIINYPQIRKYICPSLLTDSLFTKIYKEYDSAPFQKLDTIINIMEDFGDCKYIMLRYIDFKTNQDETALIIIEKFPSLINVIIPNYVTLTQKLHDQLQYLIHNSQCE